jgi:hypothetical protein
MFSRTAKFIALQCNKHGFQHSDVADLGNDAFLVNLFNLYLFVRVLNA